MIHYHAIVKGRVQGVGFRYFVQGEAVNRGMKGWVGYATQMKVMSS